MRRFCFLALGSLFAGMSWSPAEAGEVCGPYDFLTDFLHQRYEERAVVFGLPSNGKSYMEIWASDAGTWSVLVVAPNGLTCVIHSGRDFELIKDEIKETQAS